MDTMQPRKGMMSLILSQQNRLPWFASLLALTLVLLSLPARAAQVTVNCSDPKAKVKTIASGLAQLSTTGPNTLLVSGTCNENVVISGYDRLTLQGNPSATINAGSNLNVYVLEIDSSREITVNNITFTGGGSGVACQTQSVCRLNNVTITGSGDVNILDTGLFVGNWAFAACTNCTIQNSGGVGLQLNGAKMNLVAGTISGTQDAAVALGNGSLLQLQVSGAGAAGVGATIENNADGIQVDQNSTVAMSKATIRNNGVAGLTLGGASVALVSGTTITGNRGHGVRIGDLSFVRFQGSHVSGNNTLGGQYDIVCDPSFSTTRGLQSAVNNGATTNCPAEVAPNP